MKIKGQKQINSALSRWLRKKGFPLKARMATDFMYLEESETVLYSFLVPKKHDELFINVCKKLCPSLIMCDTFILSFFHEIGHYMTEDLFNDEDFEEYLNKLIEFDSKEDLTNDEYMEYYMCDIERSATEWALQYITDHPKDIKKFARKVAKLQRKFIKQNHLITT